MVAYCAAICFLSVVVYGELAEWLESLNSMCSSQYVESSGNRVITASATIHSYDRQTTDDML